MLKMTPEELAAFLREAFPELDGYHVTVELVEPQRLMMRMPFRSDFLRPGGTLSGPALMTAADTAMYLLVLAHIGPQALAVTTHLSIDFLRRPSPGDVLAKARLLKLGRRLAVGAVELEVEGALVAHATLTYSLPPRDG